MKKIYIEKINIQNFGGIAQCSQTFNSGTNIIEGKSGVGKSSLYNAYLWALGFAIPTWEPMLNGYRLHKVKTIVEVDINVEGVKYTISKTNEPKYKINKFTEEETYYGSGFEYFIDGQKIDAKEYKDKIAEIYGVDYFTLELVSRTNLFNNEEGSRWDKNARRKFLFKLFDLDHKVEALQNEEEFACLKDYLIKGNDEIEIGKIINTLKNNIEKELKSNQVLLEEKQKDLGEYASIDFDSLENKKKDIDSQISALSKELTELNKNSLLTEKTNELYALQNTLLEIEKTNKDNEIKFAIAQNNINSDIMRCEKDIEFCEEKLKTIKNDIEDLLIDKQNIEDETFDEGSTKCPTCHQELPQGEISKLRASFETDKSNRLQNISNKHENNILEQRNIETRLNTLLAKKNSLEAAKDEVLLGKPIQVSTDDIKSQISAKEEEIKNLGQNDDGKLLQEKISSLKIEYEKVIGQLSKKDELSKIKERINELKLRDRELAVQDADRIDKKNALQNYITKKVQLVNEEVNKNFEYVRYNFFEYLSSGASAEFRPVCNATLNQVEYDALSSGQKIKADFYTVSSLRRILGLDIPQFVDDIVLSDLTPKTGWQQILLLTNNTKTLSYSKISDCYSLQDCDVK